MTPKEESRYHSFVAQAQAKVDQVVDDPNGRLALRQDFYRHYGQGNDGGFGLGNSEIAFMEWEIDRGVLNPVDDATHPGSPWWRAVNGDFLRYSEIARFVFESGERIYNMPKPVRAWMAFLGQPNSQNWYRAHNTSIIQGYLNNQAIARQEPESEQLFINEVLYRLLYAQAMIEDRSIFEGLGAFGANPRLPAVDVMVHMQAFYPTHYPLSQEDFRSVLHQGIGLDDALVDFLDLDLIRPRIRRLYTEAARWSGEPDLLSFLDQNDNPVYPLPESAVPPKKKRKKVAVLGGGIASLAAVFELTSPNNLSHDEYDVTVYQMGWRLGGKGATGRNRQHGDRIEEHGLHIWSGFYDNSFRIMRECYDELGRPPTVPISTFEEAFKPLDSAFMADHFDGDWKVWPNDYPRNDAELGKNQVFLDLDEYLQMLLEQMDRLHGEGDDADQNEPVESLASRLIEDIREDGLRIGAKALQFAFRIYRWMKMEPTQAGSWLKSRESNLLTWVGQRIHRFAHAVDDRTDSLLEWLVLELLEYFMKWKWGQVKDEVETDVATHRSWIRINFFYAMATGAIKEQLVDHGLESINDQDFRTWLGKHCFDDGGIFVASSAITAIYAPAFSYLNGNNAIPEGELFSPNASLEAGTGLSWALRQTTTYRQAFIFKFKSGTAETIISPLYQVLRDRGVTFKFFHRVTRLHLSESGDSVGSISMANQVDLALGVDQYEPFLNIDGLPCWPSQPLFDQLKDGAEIEKQGINFEQTPASWKDAAELVLEAGSDFDQVLLGIPPTVFEAICPDFLKKSDKWRAMHDSLQSVATFGIQTWHTDTLDQYGWAADDPNPAITTYEATQLDTWTDMSDLLSEEKWPANDAPVTLSYFTGPLPQTAPFKIKDPTAGNYGIDQTSADQEAFDTIEKLLGEQFHFFWPDAYDSESGTFKWESLYAPGSKHSGPNRLKDQYLRANVMPTERYFLCTPGSSALRLEAYDEEFSNLYLAGSWTKNGIYIGSMEGAIMSGMLASHALSSYPPKSEVTGLYFMSPFGKAPAVEDKETG